MRAFRSLLALCWGAALIAAPIGGSAPALAGRLVTPEESNTKLESAPLSADPVNPVQQGWSSFGEPHYGYRLDYPSAWTRGTPQAYGVSLTPPSDRASALTSVFILNLPFPTTPASGKPAGKAAAKPQPVSGEKAVTMLADRYLSELKAQAPGSKVLRDKPFRWDVGTGVIMGRQIVTEFMRDGLPLQQWAVFLPSPFAPVLHLWQYTATSVEFPQTLEDAQGILNSLKPVAGK